MEHTLQNKTIPFVKVLWKHHQAVNANWELERVMREKYPALFESSTSNFKDEFLFRGENVRAT